MPDSARLSVDCRVWTKAEAERVEAALRGYEPREPRVSVALEGGFNGAHARDEWVLASDMPLRAELLARLLDQETIGG